jgi:hypothetical protein
VILFVLNEFLEILLDVIVTKKRNGFLQDRRERRIPILELDAKSDQSLPVFLLRIEQVLQTHLPIASVT